MVTFVDTSALMALLDTTAIEHQLVEDWFEGTREDETELLLTHNCVIVETASLVRRRLGPDAVRAFFSLLVPMMSVIFIDEDLHAKAVAAYLAVASRGDSIVDRLSFEVMRDQHVEQAFALDREFAREGFSVVP